MKIHIKKSHEGHFTAYKKRTGKTTEEALHSKDPHVRKMANFALQSSKWVKKEFGGTLSPEHPLSKFIKMYQEGGVTGDDPGGQGTKGATTMDSAPSTAEDNTQSGDGANQSMGNSYNPGTDPNNPVNDPNNKPVINADSSQNSPSQGYTPNPTPKTTARNVYGNLLGAGLDSVSFFEDKRNQRNAAGYNRQQGITDNVFGAQKLNEQGNRGDYNQNGAFRPNAITPQMQGITYPQQQFGGNQSRSYITDIPDEEIQKLIAKGYKIEHV